MSEQACRPSDAVALFFGIALADGEATRLDQGVMRLHGRLEARLFEDEALAAFETLEDVDAANE
jgi:hypothetical protein